MYKRQVFTLGPRINAAGRMGAPEKAARLLLSQDQEEARQLAEEIQRLNQERQVTEAAILEQVAASLDANPAQLSDRVLVPVSYTHLDVYKRQDIRR